MTGVYVWDCVISDSPLLTKTDDRDHLDALVADIIECLRGEMLYAAISSALTVPAICGQLEARQFVGKKINEERYKTWFDEFVAFKYPSRGWPPTHGSVIDEADWPPKPGVTGADAYALRNAVLHEGTFSTPSHPNRPDVNGFAFVRAVSQATMDLTYDRSTKIAYLDAANFAHNIVLGYHTWNNAVGSTEPVLSRRNKLARLVALTV